MCDLYSPEFVQAAYPRMWGEFVDFVESMDVMEPHFLTDSFLTPSAFRDWSRQQTGADGFNLPAGFEGLEFLDRAMSYRCIVCNEYKMPAVEIEGEGEGVDSWSATLVCGWDCYSVIWRNCDVCNLSQRWGMPCVDAGMPYHIDLESANV